LRKEALDDGAPLSRPQVAARSLLALGDDAQGMRRIVEAGAQLRQALVAHQHQEALLGEVLGEARVEAGWTVLDGVRAVERQRRAGRERDARQGLWRQSLHRVAVDGLDCRAGHEPLLTARPDTDQPRKIRAPPLPPRGAGPHIKNGGCLRGPPAV
jgi:hypothetical protein